jgi:hypothetical protein
MGERISSAFTLPIRHKASSSTHLERRLLPVYRDDDLLAGQRAFDENGFALPARDAATFLVNGLDVKGGAREARVGYLQEITSSLSGGGDNAGA